MMLKTLFLSTILFFSLTATAQMSAVRDVNEAWMDAAARNMSATATPFYLGSSAYAASEPYFDAEWDDMVEVTDLSTIETAFYYIRDRRFLQNREEDGFFRRITWLFPDDGCYARGALIKDRLEDVQISTAKIFIFGDLQVVTDNHPAGHVGWWYHTAPIMKDAQGDIYVLDPAIDPMQPLKVEDWVLRQVPSLDLANIAICDANTYGPSSSCSNSPPPEAMAYRDIVHLLDFEWSRQVLLKREPTEVLGDMPPWLAAE